MLFWQFSVLENFWGQKVHGASFAFFCVLRTLESVSLKILNGDGNQFSCYFSVCFDARESTLLQVFLFERKRKHLKKKECFCHKNLVEAQQKQKSKWNKRKQRHSEWHLTFQFFLRDAKHQAHMLLVGVVPVYEPWKEDNSVSKKVTGVVEENCTLSSSSVWCKFTLQHSSAAEPTKQL